MKKFKFLLKLIVVSTVLLIIVILASMAIPVIIVIGLPFFIYGSYLLYSRSLEADKDTTILDYEDKTDECK